jgi:hypothetical protein
MQHFPDVVWGLRNEPWCNWYVKVNLKLNHVIKVKNGKLPLFDYVVRIVTAVAMARDKNHDTV